MFSPHTLHTRAHEAREAGASVQALSLYEQALTTYITDTNVEGVIRVLLEKDITYRHLWFLTEQPVYLELAVSSLQVAEHTYHQHESELSDEVHALVLFHVGQISEAIGEPAEAIDVYEEALALLPADSAFAGNVLSHLAYSEWSHTNKEDAKEHFATAHHLLTKQSKEVDEHTATVWLSGSLLRQAECLLAEDRQKAASLTQEARAMLNEKDYPVRWQQLKKLEDVLNRK